MVKKDHGFAIHEAFYNEDGSIKAITRESVNPYGTTVDEFKEDLTRYLEALSKPVVDSKTLEEI